jgi:hypothetical protein
MSVVLMSQHIFFLEMEFRRDSIYFDCSGCVDIRGPLYRELAVFPLTRAKLRSKPRRDVYGSLMGLFGKHLTVVAGSNIAT